MRSVRLPSRPAHPPRLRPLALVAPLVAPLVAGLVACAGPGRAPLEAGPTPYDTLPSWRYQPLSWEKLEALEEWLAVDGPAPAGLRAEAELELAEGRLVFATREAAEVDARVLVARLEAARDGFRRALADPEASVDQRARATAGLLRARSLGTPGVAAAPPSLPRTGWGAALADPRRLTPHRGAWSRITVHHTAMESASLAGDRGSVARQLRSIQRNHMESEGMGDIGYHFLIDPSGAVLEGRSLRWRGAHAGGRNNVANVGVCLLGNFDVERPTPAALAALAALTDGLRARYGIARDAVYGHKELKGTECPGTHLQRWVAAYRRGSTPLAAAPAAPARPEPRAARSATVR